MKLTKRRETITDCRLEAEEGLRKGVKPGIMVTMKIGCPGKYLMWDIMMSESVEPEHEQFCDLQLLLFGEDGLDPERFEDESVYIITDISESKREIFAIGTEDKFIIPYWIMSKSGVLPVKTYYTEEEAIKFLEEALPVVLCDE